MEKPYMYSKEYERGYKYGSKEGQAETASKILDKINRMKGNVYNLWDNRTLGEIKEWILEQHFIRD